MEEVEFELDLREWVGFQDEEIELGRQGGGPDKEVSQLQQEEGQIQQECRPGSRGHTQVWLAGRIQEVRLGTEVELEL